MTTGRRYSSTWDDPRYWPTPVIPRPGPVTRRLREAYLRRVDELAPVDRALLHEIATRKLADTDAPVDGLAAALQSDRPEVVQAAARGLGSLKATRAIPAYPLTAIARPAAPKTVVLRSGQAQRGTRDGLGLLDDEDFSAPLKAVMPRRLDQLFADHVDREVDCLALARLVVVAHKLAGDDVKVGVRLVLQASAQAPCGRFTSAG